MALALASELHTLLQMSRCWLYLAALHRQYARKQYMMSPEYINFVFWWGEWRINILRKCEFDCRSIHAVFVLNSLYRWNNLVENILRSTPLHWCNDMRCRQSRIGKRIFGFGFVSTITVRGNWPDSVSHMQSHKKLLKTKSIFVSLLISVLQSGLLTYIPHVYRPLNYVGNWHAL